MSIAVAVFPGTNCDQDILSAAAELVPECHARRCYFHEESLPPDTSVLFLPGGFAYGDYLRVGALAKTAPLMKAIRSFAEQGGRIVGICNGFQILCDAGLLPGALMPHASDTFFSRPVRVGLENIEGTVLAALDKQRELNWPISNHSGRYFISETGLADLEASKLIFLRYILPDMNTESNDVLGNRPGLHWAVPMASEFSDHEHALLRVGGIRNKAGTIFGLMPHPERAIGVLTGGRCGADGAAFMRLLLQG
jgi:phosphoribosylformylglycinamidine synthase